MSADRPDLPTTRFRPQKTHFLAVVFIFFIAVMAMGFNPLWFAPLLLVPLAYSIWIMRVRTTVSSRGITAVYLLRPNISLPWDRFRGVLFDKRGRAFAVADDESRFSLPAITFNSLPALSAATGGLIPDPVTPAREADDAKVEIFDSSGNSVKKTPEEYEADQAEKAARAERGEAETS